MKFRKKPVVIEATQYTHQGQAIPGVCTGECLGSGWEVEASPHIHTLENKNGHTVSIGDWVITGVQGERYACKDDIFRMTYELVTERP